MHSRFPNNTCLIVWLLVVLCLPSDAAGDIVDIEFGVNTAVVTQIIIDVVDEDDNAFTLTQNNPATSGAIRAKTANLRQIALADGSILDNFSFLVPSIADSSFPTSGVVEVFSGGTSHVSGSAGFLSGLAQMHSNGDLASYVRVDFTSTDSLWKLQYGQAIDSSGFFVVEERNGNTDFSISALDINGNQIGDTLAFDAPSYQWDTSIKNHLDPISDVQTQELSVVDMSLFNTSAPIHGFSIVNSGNADFKFFFANASFSAVPEPGVLTILMLSALGLCSTRQRRNRRLLALRHPVKNFDRQIFFRCRFRKLH